MTYQPETCPCFGARTNFKREIIGNDSLDNPSIDQTAAVEILPAT